jgi:heme oxygenase
MVLASLKRRTEHLHRRVEASVAILDRLRTPGGYAALLARLYGFHEPFERRLAAVPGLDLPGLDPASRRRAARLEADLRHLGLGPGEVAALPRCAALPAPRSTAAALGCLYVVEGSALGGRVIARHVEHELGLTGAGVSFFDGDGDRVGPIWRDFCKIVEATVATAAQRHEAEEAAAETFEAFEAWVAAGPGTIA